MPPKKKPAARTLSARGGSSDDAAGSGETRRAASTRRASRSRATASAAAETKAPAVTRGRKTAVSDLTDDDADPIEDDEIGDTVVVEPETGLKRRKGRKITAKPEPAKKEPAKKRGGKKAVAVEETDPEEEERTESEVPDPEEPKSTGRGKKPAAATGKDDTPVVSAPEKKKRARKEKDLAAKEKAEREIAETQFEAMEVDLPSGDEELEIAPTPTQVHRAGISRVVIEQTVPPTAVRGRGRSRRVQEPVAGGDAEEEDDLAKPKKVLAAVGGRAKKSSGSGGGEQGEMYKDLERAYQALRTRYNNLQQAKETEAEQALKAFQTNMREKDEEGSRVIETLQSDLKAQQKAQEDFSAEARALRKKLALNETEISKLQTKVQELGKNLQDQQSENKVMSTKLVQAQAQVQAHRNSAQVPGSAVKPGYRGPLGNPKTNAGAVDDAWLAKAKEDLYADLCGLIIVNVRKESDNTIFECVQTGVNGLAVHFKLLVPNQQHVRVKKTPATLDPADDEVADEDEIIFIPLFDETRDKTVIDLLPVYLRDEISFQRDHMTKFYQKVNSLFMVTINAQQPEEESEEDKEDDDEGE